MDSITKYFCKLELKYFDNKMLQNITYNKIHPFNSRNEILRVIYEIAGKSPVENLIMICMDSMNRINAIYIAGIGNSFNVVAGTKEMLSVVLLSNAEKVIVAHNHPGLYDPLPTVGDQFQFRQFRDALMMFGIYNFDSYIVSQIGFYDMQEGEKKDKSFSRKYHYKNKKGKIVYGIKNNYTTEFNTNADLSFLNSIEGENKDE